MWDLVFFPPGKRAIDNKWVFSKKEGAKKANEARFLHTAWLVARGDLQSKGVDYGETFTPVVKLVSLRILLTHATRTNLETRHWDITGIAFLNGDIDQEVYMKQPNGFDDGSGRVCRLRKAIYGLCQSARAFFQKLDSVLKARSWIHTEWAMWKLYDNLVGSHVDDMCIVASDSIRDSLCSDLKSERLPINDLGDLTTYVSIQIVRDRPHCQIQLHQQEYASKCSNLLEWKIVTH